MTVTIDTLRDADVEAALPLSTREEWNQTDADWRRLLRLAPGGCFAARIGGRLVGTVTTTSYGPELAWIGMMIVHPDARWRGIGEALMTCALEHLDVAGVSCIKLDATPAGEPLYRRLGFEEEVLFERWQGVTRPTDARASPADFPTALGAVFPLDRAAFGADRSRLLAMLEADALSVHVLHQPDLHAEGYALARGGRIANYLGPIVSTERAIAERLLDALSARFAGRRVCIDVNTGGLLHRDHLVARGLAPTRPLMRMRRGESTASVTRETLCASAGPEYG
jgi:predicted N-acetyltransferase YhbS